mmetsp:Transcript_14188/g.42839  ORF Transcript_14188/g.42839 Transcript_14188/m.42839 type:complete len:218 (-) Transcript_14188:1487-2140(-)
MMSVGSQVSMPQYLASQQQCTRAALSVPVCRQASRKVFRQQRCQRQVRRSAVHRQILCAANTAEQGKLISKVEIPAFIPRSDMSEQLFRWATAIGQDEGQANFGLPMRVVPNERGDGSPNGFTLDIVRDGVTVTTLAILFDDEISQKHEWVGRGADGFPTLEGKVSQILGKHLMIRKICEGVVDEEIRTAIRGFCEALVSALNKYYAFGSCFTDDTT